MNRYTERQWVRTTWRQLSEKNSRTGRLTFRVFFALQSRQVFFVVGSISWNSKLRVELYGIQETVMLICQHSVYDRGLVPHNGTTEKIVLPTIVESLKAEWDPK